MHKILVRTAVLCLCALPGAAQPLSLTLKAQPGVVKREAPQPPPAAPPSKLERLAARVSRIGNDHAYVTYDVSTNKIYTALHVKW